MAARNHPLFSWPSQQVSSPTIPATHPSPLRSGTLGSYPITTPPFSSSPPLSSDQARSSSASPDLFEDLDYSEAMEDDLYRIDSEVASILGAESQSYRAISPPNNGASFPASHNDQRTWVVFNGKVPGIYDCW